MESDLIEKALSLFGTTNDCNNAGYILPDGHLLNLKQDEKAGRETHDAVRFLYDEAGEDIVKLFIKETGSIRLHHAQNTTFVEMDKQYEPTYEQMEAVRICACEQGLEPHRIVYDVFDYDNFNLVKTGDVTGGFHDLSCNKVVTKFINELMRVYRE